MSDQAAVPGTWPDWVAALRLVDHHCHSVLGGELDAARFGALLTEAPAPAPGADAFDSAVGLAVRRECAPVLDLPVHAPARAYLARRAELGVAEGPQNHVLDVYLVDGRPVELLLDGESVFPVWFKLEFKETGELSAKVKGFRLGTRFGDEINIHNGTP